MVLRQKYLIIKRRETMNEYFEKEILKKLIEIKNETKQMNRNIWLWSVTIVSILASILVTLMMMK